MLVLPSVIQTPPAIAPTAPQSPQPFVVNPAQVPRTGQEVQAIRIKLRDLQNQLQTAVERRMSVTRQMDNAPARAQAGLEARLGELDGRIVALEQEITRTSALLQAAPAEAVLAGTTQSPDPAQVIERIADDLVPLVAILAVFVFAPIAITISRFFWKRSSGPARGAAAAPDHATQQKLENLQQAMDTIAIEIERISEGQRFVARLLNERAVGAGGAEAPPMPARKSPIGADRP
jgi:hypothetical protein